MALVGKTRLLALAPPILGLAGAVVPLVGAGFSGWGLSVAWIAGLLLVGLSFVVLRPDPPTRVFIDIIGLVLTLVVLMPEGGWWFVPAVTAQFFLDRRRAVAVVGGSGERG